MQNTVTFINQRVPRASASQRVHHLLIVDSRGLDVAHGEQRIHIKLERHVFSTGAELRLAYQDGDSRGLVYADQLARIGECRIVPRAIVYKGATPVAVYVEFQAEHPRQLVRVAA